MPPASAKEKATTRYAKERSEVAERPDDADDHGDGERHRERERHEPDDHAREQLERDDRHRGDDHPGQHALADRADGRALTGSGSGSGVVHLASEPTPPS